MSGSKDGELEGMVAARLSEVSSLTLDQLLSRVSTTIASMLSPDQPVSTGFEQEGDAANDSLSVAVQLRFVNQDIVTSLQSHAPNRPDIAPVSSSTAILVAKTYDELVLFHFLCVFVLSEGCARACVMAVSVYLCL